MGSNGIVTETAHHNVDRDKFGSNYDKIFGKKGYKEPTQIEKLARKISDNHPISTCLAHEIIRTVSIELQSEVDYGYLAEELLNQEREKVEGV